MRGRFSRCVFRKSVSEGATENAPRPTATLAPATVPPAPSGSDETRAGCSGSHAPGGGPGGASIRFLTPAPLPQNSKTSPTTTLHPYIPPLYRTPHARPTGSADSRGLAPTAADPEKGRSKISPRASRGSHPEERPFTCDPREKYVRENSPRACALEPSVPKISPDILVSNFVFFFT